MADLDQQLDAALELMRRLPPQKSERNLSDIIDLVPELCEDLLASVDQPLKVLKCTETGKNFLLCDYNRDGDSYRSPHSNEYQDPIDDGAKPSDEIRELEIQANQAFDSYRDLYYDGGISSVYLWDLADGFAGAILIKKAGDNSSPIKGCWDSVHVIEVKVKPKVKSATYKLTSTVILWLQTTRAASGIMNLCGQLTRQVEKDEKINEKDANQHIVNIGRLVEDNENKMRNTLNEIYFSKTRDVLNDLRSTTSLAEKDNQKKVAEELRQKLSTQQSAK